MSVINPHIGEEIVCPIWFIIDVSGTPHYASLVSRCWCSCSGEEHLQEELEHVVWGTAGNWQRENQEGLLLHLSQGKKFTREYLCRNKATMHVYKIITILYVNSHK